MDSSSNSWQTCSQQVILTEIEEMSWQKKSKLIQNDPVTCGHMVQIFMKQFLKSSLAPVGEITDLFYRLELQYPYIHALFRIKDAPQYGVNSLQEIVDFVDKYVTCKDDSSKEMTTFVNFQTHRHEKTCKKEAEMYVVLTSLSPPWPEQLS